MPPAIDTTTDLEPSSQTDGDAEVDGRTARRERGRLAAIDATVDLVLEGHSPPTAEQIAERAGISAASLFRYYDNLNLLRQAAAERYFQRYAHLLTIPDVGQGTLDERILRLVESRVELYEATAPMCRFVRYRAVDVPLLDQTVRQTRASRTEEIRRHFAAELARLNPAARDDVVAVISTLTSFESWDQIRNDLGRNESQTRRCWRAALRQILTAT